MAKVKVNNLKNVTSNIRLKITKELRAPEFRKGIGDIVVEEIKETNLGTPSAATKAWRKYLEEGNKKDPKYEPDKIKALFTGELLEDLRNNVRLSSTKGAVEYIIEQTNKLHKKYKKPNGKPTKGKRQTFKQIQGFLEDLGYKYITNAKNSEEMTKKILKFIRKELFERLK